MKFKQEENIPLYLKTAFSIKYETVNTCILDWLSGF